MESTDILPEKRFFRIDEVAHIIGVTPQTVRNWIDEGRLKCCRFTKQTLRVKREDLLIIISSESE
jgi:excisionase family DNA binding protein